MREAAHFRRFWLFAGVAACVILPSCRTTNSSQHAWSYNAGGATLTAEDLLDSEGGPYTMVEQGDDSPTALHAMAKKAQDPRYMGGMPHKGIDYELAAQSEDSYKHTVRLVRNGEEPPPLEVAEMMPARSDLIIDSGMTPPTPDRKPETQVEAEQLQIAQADVPVPQEKPRFTQEMNAEQVAAIEPAAGGDDDKHDGGAVEISALRFGTHPGKVRMVFDLSGPASFEHQLNNRAKTLSIEIPDAEWRTGRESELLKSPLVEGYTTSHEGRTTKVDLTLRKPVKIIWAAALKPENGKGNRLVLDLAAL